jgi:hypothetical protein
MIRLCPIRVWPPPGLDDEPIVSTWAQQSELPALGDGIEHGLHIGGGARDDPQDLRGGRLLREGLGEIGVLGLELGEQPRVFDGDGGLIGEGFQQSEVAVGERSNLVPPDDDHSQQLVSPEHGEGQQGPEGELPAQISELGVRLDIVNVNGAPFKGDTPGGAPASGRDGIPLDELRLLGGEVMDHHGSKELTIEAEDYPLLRLAQPDRVLGQGLEDGLEVEGGAADYLEQLAGGCRLLEGDPQLAVARLQFLEQAHILDGDHPGPRRSAREPSASRKRGWARPG